MVWMIITTIAITLQPTIGISDTPDQHQSTSSVYQPREGEWWILPARDSDGYHESFAADTPSSQLASYFNAYGFVIIRDVVNTDLQRTIIDDIWDQVRRRHYGIDEYDDDNDDNKPTDTNGILPFLSTDGFATDGSPYSPFQWRQLNWSRIYERDYNERKGFLGNGVVLTSSSWIIRQLPSIHHAFSSIWNTEKLRVKLDRYGIMRPTKLRLPITSGTDYNNDEWMVEEHPEWLTDPTFMHWDQNPFTEPGMKRVQGLVTLSDHNDTSGGFHCIPGFAALHFERWTELNHHLRATIGTSSLVNIPSDDPALAGTTRLTMRAGSLLIWDSRLPHGNYPNTGYHFRYVQYLTMLPAIHDEWTMDIFTRHPSLYDLEYYNVTLTTLGRRLAGLDAWN